MVVEMGRNCVNCDYAIEEGRFKRWTDTVYVAAITKTCLYNFDPLKPHFYIVKLGLTGVYIIFLIFCSKHRFLVLVRTTLSSYVLSRTMENIRFFYLKIFILLVVKFSVYLNRHALVMALPNSVRHTLPNSICPMLKAPGSHLWLSNILLC